MFLSDFKDWLKRPFATDMDAFHWFLFFGLIVVISILWSLVLRHTLGGVEI